MKSKQGILKIVNDLVNKSFVANGEVNELAVRKNAKILSSLSPVVAVEALSEYLKRLQRRISQTVLQIESSQQLNSTQIKYITQKFKDSYFVTDVRTKINSSLLGGIKIRIGDEVFDDSIVAKIEQVRKAITN